MYEYQNVIHELRAAYNREEAERRDGVEKEDWKIIERQQFLECLQREGKTTLLEIGAGTGTDSLFFQERGLHVVCTDLSPNMVTRCHAKGLEAYMMDFLSLNFQPASFDALYALNCLLHVPTHELPSVLGKLRDMLRPTGLFFLGVYGGIEKEGVSEQDWHKLPRFFSYHTDSFMQQAVVPFFDIVSFKAIPLQRDDVFHFQSMLLRKS